MGLFILVTPHGSKLWQMKYRFDGRERLASFGQYPVVSLSEARKKALEARQLISRGVDPNEKKLALKAAKYTFDIAAKEWLSKNSQRWTAKHTEKVRTRLAKHVSPWLGSRPVAEISTLEILSVLRRVEATGHNEMTHCCQQYTACVFRYAVQCGLLASNPAADLRGALTPVTVKHYSAITEPKAVGELLRAVDGYQGNFVVSCALRLAPLLFVRPGELRSMEWSEIDFETATWRIPAAKMKMRREHIVPLSRQALAILEEIRPLTGNGRFVFPSERTRERCMSENTIGSALRRLGYSREEMTGHGFRTTASTLLNELGFKPDVIELQLAHKEQGVRAVYHRSEYLGERREMMQSWADYLEGLKQGGQVIALRSRAIDG